jgi:hypothetical protein
VVVVSYRYKAEYKPIAKVLRDSFPIWGKDSVFKPFSDDEMWTDAGEQEVSSRLWARLGRLPGEASFQCLENNSSSISGYFHSVPIEQRIGQTLVQTHRCSQRRQH